MPSGGEHDLKGEPRRVQHCDMVLVGLQRVGFQLSDDGIQEIINGQQITKNVGARLCRLIRRVRTVTVHRVYHGELR